MFKNISYFGFHKRNLFFFLRNPQQASFYFRILVGNQIDLLNTKLEDDSKFEGNRAKESLLSCEHILYNVFKHPISFWDEWIFWGPGCCCFQNWVSTLLVFQHVRKSNRLGQYQQKRECQLNHITSCFTFQGCFKKAATWSKLLTTYPKQNNVIMSVDFR